MIVVPPPPIQTEYPETLATIHSNPLCAAAEPKFAVQLVADSIQRALSENLKVDLIDDHAVACAVRHSFKTGPEKHKAGLLLRTVPQIICTWLRQKQESKPDAGGVYIDGVLAGEYMRRLETT